MTTTGRASRRSPSGTPRHHRTNGTPRVKGKKKDDPRDLVQLIYRALTDQRIDVRIGPDALFTPGEDRPEELFTPGGERFGMLITLDADKPGVFVTFDKNGCVIRAERAADNGS